MLSWWWNCPECEVEGVINLPGVWKRTRSSKASKLIFDLSLKGKHIAEQTIIFLSIQVSGYTDLILERYHLYVHKTPKDP